MENTTQHKIEKIVVGITHGDINGIGYEVILKAFKDPRMLEFFTPVIYGSPKVAAYYKKVLKLSQVQLNHVKSIDKISSTAVNIINCVDNKVRVEIGRPTEISGKAAIDALNAAIADLNAGKLDAIVTAPISKQAVYNDDFNFKGHTWFFADKFGVEDVLMFMVYNDLRIAVATDHIPLKDVPEAITEDLILNKLALMEKSLKNDFSIEKPKIAVLSLNPHAGDNGLIGTEEKDVIIPALEKAKDKGMVVLGPYPADGFFSSDNYKNFDGILALYHDQGMLPFKVLSYGKGVNFTAGLPIIRTSPAHGTAYDIAGLNMATPDSFINALFLARDIYKNRKRLENIQPLEKQNMEELLPTLMPAKPAELEEMESILDLETAEEESNATQNKRQDSKNGNNANKHKNHKYDHEHKHQQEHKKESQEQEQKLDEPAQQPEPESETVISGNHPDVEVETIDETSPEDRHEQKHAGFIKIKQKFQQHKHKQEKKHRSKPNPNDYKDLT